MLDRKAETSTLSLDDLGRVILDDDSLFDQEIDHVLVTAGANALNCNNSTNSSNCTNYSTCTGSINNLRCSNPLACNESANGRCHSQNEVDP